MVETYTYVGNSPSWIVAFMPVPAIIVFSFQRRAKGLRPFAWWQAVTILWFLLGSLAGLPMEWILGGACYGGAVAVPFLRPKPETPKALRWLTRGWLLCPLYFAIGVVWIMEPTGFPHRISLGDSSATQYFLGRTDTVLRTGLRVDFMRSHLDWLEVIPGGSWTSYSGERTGPDISGSGVYWGPRGLIHGDPLGQHLASWAHVKPKLIASAN